MTNNAATTKATDRTTARLQIIARASRWARLADLSREARVLVRLTTARPERAS